MHITKSHNFLHLQTRILVTHGISFLPKVDKIVVLVDGKISEMGSFHELVGHAGAFAEFLKNYLTDELDTSLDEEDIQGRNLFHYTPRNEVRTGGVYWNQVVLLSVCRHKVKATIMS